MILLDTNVVSALMQKQPDPAVLAWLDAQSAADIPLDALAAEQAALLAATRRAKGRVIDLRDTLIAGIALARQAQLATRNLRHFDDTTISLISPFAH